MSFSNGNKYVCKCGREFTSSQAFNGHKSGCKVHQINKYGSLDKFNEHKRQVGLSLKNTLKIKNDVLRTNNRVKDAKLLEKWISEQHNCETCGKVMTEKFGSGRFCCRSCANTRHHSDNTKSKISKATRQRYSSNEYRDFVEHSIEQKRLIKISEYNLNPKLCKFCGKPIAFELKHRTYCSEECRCNSISNILHNKFKSEGLTHLTYKHNFKYGNYKGYSCDSSYELAFVMYNLDHNISIIRNTKDSFEYVYENKTHNFFPDFIVDDTYVELKSWHSADSKRKADCVPNTVKFKILYKEDMKPYIDYAKSVYGKEFYKLYDRNYPSWMDKFD